MKKTSFSLTVYSTNVREQVTKILNLVTVFLEAFGELVSLCFRFLIVERLSRHSVYDILQYVLFCSMVLTKISWF